MIVAGAKRTHCSLLIARYSSVLACSSGITLLVPDAKRHSALSTQHFSVLPVVYPVPVTLRMFVATSR